MKRELRDRFTGNEGERAVSPVVGVALLIAITVILAAVIGFVVLDTSSETTDTSNARLDFSGDASSGVTVSHEGGDTFNTTNVYYKVSGGTEAELSTTTLGVGKFNTGDSFNIPSGDLTSGDTVTIYWDDPKSDREVQVGKFTVE